MSIVARIHPRRTNAVPRLMLETDPVRRATLSQTRDVAPVDPQLAGSFATKEEASTDEQTGMRTRRRIRLAPVMSAQASLTPAQAVVLSAVALLVGTGLVLWPFSAWAAIVLAATLPFIAVALIRASALCRELARSQPGQPSPSTSQRGSGLSASESREHWPAYAVLVPLYDESETIPGLVRALSALDYPADRLEVALIVEASDAPTRAAIAACTLPVNFRVVVVPEGRPRTKPRALNHALEDATGEIVAVYDAEDTPDPAQLKAAAERFRADRLQGDGRLACLQAALLTDNPRDSWLAGQFTIEYLTLFKAILPTLEALRLPIPLGGTSNHFRRDHLEAVGAWDAFNVTEDADLGIRLARHGLRVGTLQSQTLEEAPASASVWLGQRRRWMKGWMQTLIVHNREPLRTFRDLGPRGWLGLQVMMGAMILSALFHPIMVAALLAAILATIAPALANLALPLPAVPDWIGITALASLIIGYLAAIALNLTVAIRNGQTGLAAHALLTPVYWLFISFAAYQSFWQLLTSPHRWEKTRHRPRP